jgi:hypothetical protein
MARKQAPPIISERKNCKHSQPTNKFFQKPYRKEPVASKGGELLTKESAEQWMQAEDMPH